MAIKIPKIKKKTSLGSRLAAALMGVIALAIIAFFGFSNWRIFNERQVMEAKIENLRRQVQILEEKRETLKAGLAAAQGEGFQEERLREQGYKKPGEEVIAVLRDGANSAIKQEDAAVSDNFWMNLWKKIKNIQ